MAVLTLLYGSATRVLNQKDYNFHISSLLPNSETYRHQQGPNIGSHTTTTTLTTHWCILTDYFSNRNFSKHKLMRSLMMV